MSLLDPLSEGVIDDAMAVAVAMALTVAVMVSASSSCFFLVRVFSLYRLVTVWYYKPS